MRPCSRPDRPSACRTAQGHLPRWRPVDLAHLGEPATSGGVVTEKCTRAASAQHGAKPVGENRGHEHAPGASHPATTWRLPHR